MKNRIGWGILSALLFSLPMQQYSRSPFRTKGDPIPRLITSWWSDDPNDQPSAKSKKCHFIADSHITPYPIFTLNTDMLMENLLPQGNIYHRKSDTRFSSGEQLSKLTEQLIREINQGKNNFSHFHVLQRKNFNARKMCGLLVLKFNDHPFVLKLFMETPKTFVNPYCKGIEPTCFFFMGNGVNRHMTGFTRIPNARQVEEMIAHMPRWKNVVEIPRKWFWTPKNNRLIRATGENVGTRGKIENVLPSIYAIIADAIPIDKGRIPGKSEHSRIVMSLCNDLNLRIDAHRDNFIFLKDPGEKREKIVIIDTEHFPTLVGVKEQNHTFKNSMEWYGFLMTKCTYDTFLRTKKTRRQDQINSPHNMALIV